ncbi:MAG: response regulator transcription factor [Anaerolineae bacterium]|nr:response regulator transcription factor [Anaerolineae bacterium]
MNENLVLVVEDEPSVGEIVSLYLRRAGFQVEVIDDGQKALQWLKQNEPTLVVLDLMLPGADGWEITRQMRARNDTPIIMLTARREEMDRIAGLEMGADDYLTKPFSPQELVSRVRAVLRRTRPVAPAESETKTMSFGKLVIDIQARRVLLDGEEKTLTAKEFDLLLHLARHPRQVFSRDQLLERIWGESDYIDPGTVTVHIRRLREKIENDPAAPVHLQTVWGVGYRFEP